MRVHVVDPSAYTPPYDHALCRALGEAGAEVQLHTSRFSYAPVAVPRAYTRHESFYRLAHRRGAGGPRGRTAQAIKLAEHVPDMLRYRRTARTADIVHFQWLTVQPLDVHLLPTGRPLVITAHDVLPREPKPGQMRAQQRLYERMDAVVVHSEHGRARLTEQLRVDPAKVHVIPHGVLRPWEDADDAELSRQQQRERLLPPEFGKVQGPVVLFFGLLRPYKGLDVLLEAWRGIEGAELWIVGMPRMDIAPLQDAAPPGVRFLPRFLGDTEIPAFLRRAYVVVLPYREIDQSGAAFTALGAGTPLVLSDVGGFPELAATGAVRLVAAGDAGALRAALEDLLDNPDARAEMARRARETAEGAFGWEGIARKTLALYESLLSVPA